MLRYWAPSQYQGRYSLAESEWHGVTIPAGEALFLLTGAASRDEREYENPDVFDIDREIGLTVGFGHGIHVCIGAALARWRPASRSRNGRSGGHSSRSTKRAAGE